jgi:hypothetical protein
LQSRADDVVPFADSEELVKNSGLPVNVLIETGNDHRLADPESLDLMLSCCSDNDDEQTNNANEGSLLERDWTGLCYMAALKWVCENRDWTLVHGTILSWDDDAESRRIGHAWCERGDLVVDLAAPKKARMIELARYCKAVEPETNKVYSSANAILMVYKNKHDGPWDDFEQLKE